MIVDDHCRRVQSYPAKLRETSRKCRLGQVGCNPCCSRNPGRFSARIIGRQHHTRGGRLRPKPAAHTVLTRCSSAPQRGRSCRSTGASWASPPETAERAPRGGVQGPSTVSGGRPALKMLYVAAIRAFEPWRRIRVTELEPRDLECLQTQIIERAKQKNEPVIRSISTPQRISSTKRT